MSSSGGTQYAEKHGMVKLTTQQVNEIRKKLLTQTGISIAIEYKVSQSLISAIKSGRLRRKG
jgi:F0F1-type ATP synthase delta subunit